MARNEVFRMGDFLSLPVPADTKSGDPLRIGGTVGLNGVAQTNRAGDAAEDPLMGPEVNTNPVGNATVWLVGAWRFQVDFAVTTVGEPIYITPANVLTAVAAGNHLYGHALSTKTAPLGDLIVRITN
jgi:hypothetical protein